MSITTKTFYFFLSFLPHVIYPLTLMLDPAGDAKHPGKLIGNIYERTITNKLVHDLKDQFALSDKHIRVLMSRLPGEYKDHIEKVRCVYQCAPDYFIHITVYASTQIKPQIFLYMNEEKKLMSPVHTFLLPIDQAHNPYAERSKKFTQTLYTSLQQKTAGICDIHAPVGIPCSILKGIPTRGCIIEIGIKDSTAPLNCTAQLAESILHACKENMT